MPFTIIPMKTKFFHSYSLVLNVVPGKEQVLLSYVPTDSVNGAPVTAVSTWAQLIRNHSSTPGLGVHFLSTRVRGVLSALRTLQAPWQQLAAVIAVNSASSVAGSACVPTELNLHGWAVSCMWPLLWFTPIFTEAHTGTGHTSKVPVVKRRD